MNEQIQSLLKEWATSDGLYSFEKRVHIPWNPSQITKDAPAVINMVFIIDVDGFFIDKDHTQPIKLHHEEILPIDRFNADGQYLEKLRKDLETVTTAAYDQFEKTLSSLPQPTYTSDPKFMK